MEFKYKTIVNNVKLYKLTLKKELQNKYGRDGRALGRTGTFKGKGAPKCVLSK